MAKQFKLSVVAPDRTVFEDMVESFIAPGVNGYLGVMADHEPSIVALKTGIVEYIDASDQKHFVSIGGGFLEIDGGSAIILADTAQKSTEIDLERAEEALEEARKALRGEESTVTMEQAAVELDRAMNRINAAKHN